MGWLKFEFSGQATYTEFQSFMVNEGFVGDVYYTPGSSGSAIAFVAWLVDSRKQRIYKYGVGSFTTPATFTTDFPNAFSIPTPGFAIDNAW